MERRGFLKGLFGGIAAGGLIVTATPREVQALALAPETPLVVVPTPQAPVSVGMELFNARGEQVALVTSVDMGMSMIDVTSFSDPGRQYVDGFHDVRIEAMGLPGVDWTSEWTRPGRSRRR